MKVALSHGSLTVATCTSRALKEHLNSLLTAFQRFISPMFIKYDAAMTFLTWFYLPGPPTFSIENWEGRGRRLVTTSCIVVMTWSWRWWYYDNSITFIQIVTYESRNNHNMEIMIVFLCLKTSWCSSLEYTKLDANECIGESMQHTVVYMYACTCIRKNISFWIWLCSCNTLYWYNSCVVIQHSGWCTWLCGCSAVIVV